MKPHMNAMCLFCTLFCLALSETAHAVLAESASAGADFEAHLENELEANIRAASAREAGPISSGPLSKELYKSVRQQSRFESLREKNAIPLMWNVKFHRYVVDVYHGYGQGRPKSRPGVNGAAMRKKFHKQLISKTRKFIQLLKGGHIEEFGEFNPRNYRGCPKRPGLKMKNVIALARTSFGIKNFKPAIPPCNNMGRLETCKEYDYHKCCRRPQAEFLGRYYDTAVAAMALGASADEAFAPVFHARGLALALQNCEDVGKPEPKLRDGRPIGNVLRPHRTAKLHYQFWIWSKSLYTGKRARETWNYPLSVVAIPVQYEVLYELYNSMLIERMKSRKRAMKVPSVSKMDKLRGQVYYKKVLLQVAPLNFDLKPEFVLPNASNFRKAGLRITPSVRMAAGVEESTEHNSVSSMNYLPHANTSRVQNRLIFQQRTKSWVTRMTSSTCNDRSVYPQYFLKEDQNSVWDKYQTCCANECHFMSLYGRSFSVGGTNCCAGCNRFSCKANSFSIAKILADMGTIETSGKLNSPPEILTIFV